LLLAPGFAASAKEVPPAIQSESQTTGKADKERKSPVIAARVNSQKITTAELDKRVDQIMQRGQQNPAMGPPPDRDELRVHVLNQMIAEKLLLQDAVKKKMDVDSAKIDAEMTLIKGEGRSDAELAEMLKQSGMTPNDLRHVIRSNLTVEAYIDSEVASKVKIDEQQVSDFYEAHPRYFETPEQVHARHILILLKEESTEEEKTAAETRVNALLARVEKGEDFAQIATDNSEDPGSKFKGGDLGFFPRGMMVPEFEEAAFALEPGRTSKVVKTNYGFHIIRCEEKKEVRKTPLTEVSEKIEHYLRDQEIGRLLDEHIASLRKSANVKVSLPQS